MARSRKNANAVKAGTTAKTGVIVLLIVGSCVGYVWLKKEIASLSAGIRVREARLKSLQDGNDKMRPALAGLLSPEVLDAKVREMRLGLAQPDISHIWRLPEPAAMASASPLENSSERASRPSFEYAAQRPLKAQAP